VAYRASELHPALRDSLEREAMLNGITLLLRLSLADWILSLLN